jgi:hypothetical protein
MWREGNKGQREQERLRVARCRGRGFSREINMMLGHMELPIRMSLDRVQ